MASGLTRRNAPPLLKTVGGKPHANDDHHEEPASKGRPNASLKSKRAKDIEEALINAEPMSSDEELQRPPARPSPSVKRKLPAASTDTDTELKQPQRKTNKKGSVIRTPLKGLYRIGKTDKAKRGIEDNKENASSTQSTSEASEAKAWDFDDELGEPPPRKQRTHYGAKRSGPSTLTNIHVLPAKKSDPGPSQSPRRAKGKISYTRKHKVELQEHDDVSDASMISLEEPEHAVKAAVTKVHDPELRTIEHKPKLSKEKTGSSKPTTMGDAELNNMLDEPSKAARLLHQLDQWVQDQAPLSSQPESSAPQQALDKIHDYIDQLPQEEEEGTLCALCKETVELEDYWEFWKGKDKTIKNHTAFCNVHRRKSAQEDYDREGYPTIDWDTLPKRIQKHRMDLFQVLNNDRLSEYRDRYEPIALTGKAAAVPSRRKDLSEDIQRELDSYALDGQATYPGYYGPHGRRAITESIMKILKNEIKNCKDPVVQASGPAAFIQAVLVPEIAILLIMEDCKADRDEAEEIREKTYEMGILLNEEIEDKVEAQYDSDDDANDYHHG
ncbi:RTC4-like domain-containing protein [Pyrenochaeta sp. MPI-SDFR-AT-0127]|nr:RTC4-like domain-containing protein [Pyrenochaeta sp. MPI-SDFR-AT-0127]